MSNLFLVIKYDTFSKKYRCIASFDTLFSARQFIFNYCFECSSLRFFVKEISINEEK